jgi:tetratricopeptide (TPR) repeat protein
VDKLYEVQGYYHEVIDKLRADKTIAEPERKIALQIANSRLRVDAYDLQNEACQTVLSSKKNREAYRAALEKAQKANDWEPNDPAVLTTLGAAQYRLGSYQEALKTLAEAEQVLPAVGGESDPTNVAFKSMALHKIGRIEEAKHAIEQLRELYRDEQFAEDVEVQDLLAEAEKLITGEKQ